jgi:hypothetical protein
MVADVTDRAALMVSSPTPPLLTCQQFAQLKMPIAIARF